MNTIVIPPAFSMPWTAARPANRFGRRRRCCPFRRRPDCPFRGSCPNCPYGLVEGYNNPRMYDKVGGMVNITTGSYYGMDRAYCFNCSGPQTTVGIM